MLSFHLRGPLGVSGWKGRVRNKARGGGMYVLCEGWRIYFDDNVAHFLYGATPVLDQYKRGPNPTGLRPFTGRGRVTSQPVQGPKARSPTALPYGPPRVSLYVICIIAFVCCSPVYNLCCHYSPSRFR